MSDNRFPIKDIQFHEDRLREAADEAAESVFGWRDENISIAWHSTAIAYLEIGVLYGLSGPAVEHEDGRVELIEDHLTPTTDSHGQTQFLPVIKFAEAA